MGAQIRIMQQNEADQGFSLLKDIVEMVKNPAAIDEAYERRQKAAQLTDEEVAKSTEARAIISQADEFKAGLKQKEDQLAADRDSLNNDIASVKNNAIAETLRLTNWAAQLNDIATQQAKDHDIIVQQTSDLVTQKQKLDEHENLWEIDYKNRIDAVTQIEQDQKDEDQRLADWAARLKAKAASLATLAQQDE